MSLKCQRSFNHLEFLKATFIAVLTLLLGLSQTRCSRSALAREMLPPDAVAQMIRNDPNSKPELTGFMPDFKKPKNVYHFQHTLLGSVTVEIYLAELNGKPIEWHMAKEDQTGRVWIDRIRVMDGTTNSYGTDQEIINSGLLTNKPLEYSQLSDGLEIPTEMMPFRGYYHEDGRELYNDITPILSNLLPIQNFIKVKRSAALD